MLIFCRFLSETRIDQALTPRERAIFDLERVEANRCHAGTIGWRMENMVSLAWALNHPAEPRVDAEMIDGAPLYTLVYQFMPDDRAAIPDWIKTQALRPLDQLAEMEDRFYCLHNAARSAQIAQSQGEDMTSVPSDFDPTSKGGVIHERRLALTWVISANTPWDETDLST